MGVPRSFFDFYSQSARRFADHYQNYVQQYRADFTVLDEEFNNFIQALAIYSQRQTWLELAQLVQELGVYLDTRGYWNEHRFWLERALDHKDKIPNQLTKMELLDDLAAIVSSQGNRDWARSLYQEVIAIAEREKDEMHVARAYFGLGTVYLNLDKKEDAQACLEKALEVAERIKDELLIASIHFFLQLLLTDNTNAQGTQTSPESFVIPQLRVAPQAGVAGKALSVQFRAMQHFVRGHYRQAQSNYLEGLELAREEGDRQGEAFSLYQLGQIAHLENNVSIALEYYEQSAWIAKGVGDRTGLRSLYSAMSLAYIQQQRFDLARPLLEESLAFEREVGDQAQVAEKLYWLGYALANTGELKRAKDIFEESLDIFSGLNSPRIKDVRDVLSRIDTLLNQENG